MLTILPVILIAGIAGYALYSQDKMAQKIATAHAKSVVDRVAEFSAMNDLTEPFTGNGGGHGRMMRHRSDSFPDMELPTHGRMMRRRSDPFFNKELPSLGWVAKLSPEGRVVQISPGGAITSEIKDALLKMRDNNLEEQSFISDNRGLRHVVAVLRDGNYYYVAAVSWERFAAFSPSLFPQILLAMAIFLVCLTFFTFWKWVLAPLQTLFEDMKRLKLGSELAQNKGQVAIAEVEELRGALADLAQVAVERDNLKRNYLNDIVRTQVSERLSIAQDLHDGALQAISAVSQRIQLALRGLKRGEQGKTQTHLLAAQEAVDFSIQEMRSVCDTLSPPWVSLGLLATLDEIGNRLAISYGIEILIDAKPLPEELSSDQVLAICRIVQEAVANAVRHGQANEVKVEASTESKHLVVTISDNGKGFTGELDPEQLRVAGHRGISGMTERASMLGGQISISPQEQGVVVRLQIPYPLESTHLPSDKGV